MISLPLWASAIFVLYGVYGITGWIPTVMMQRGETFAASFSYGALIMGSSFFGTLACGYLADRLGRSREILTVWWCAGALCITVLALVNLHWLNVLCLAGAGFFIVGAQGGLNNFTAGSVRHRDPRHRCRLHAGVWTHRRGPRTVHQRAPPAGDTGLVCALRVARPGRSVRRAQRAVRAVGAA